MEATVFHCPQCGAVVDQKETQCRYCHALLKTVACPKCLGMMFAGVEFCPHCGVRVKAIGQPLAAGTSCPRCTTALKRFDVGGTPLDECPNCGGMWLSVAAFEHVCSNEAAQAAAEGLLFPTPQHAKIELEETVHYIRCPQCSNLMNRMNYAGSGNIVSVCRGHGIWLDCDELRRIIDFIRSGALQRQHLREDEKLAREKKFADLERNLPSTGSHYSTVAGPGYGLDSSLVGQVFQALAHLFS